MGNELVLQKNSVSKIRKFWQVVAKIAISPFYRKIEEGKTSHCTISFMVESDAKTKGLIAGVGVGARQVKGVAAAGFISTVPEDCIGVHVAGGMTLTTDMRGFSASMFNLIGETNKGVAFGLIGTSVGADIDSWTIGDYCSGGAVIGGIYASTHENTKGFVFGGIMSVVRGKMRGITAGLVNLADSFEGFRIGLVNMILGNDEPSKGVEIGLLNIRLENPWWARVVPIIAIRLGKNERKEE